MVARIQAHRALVEFVLIVQPQLPVAPQLQRLQHSQLVLESLPSLAGVVPVRDLTAAVATFPLALVNYALAPPLLTPVDASPVPQVR